MRKSHTVLSKLNTSVGKQWVDADQDRLAANQALNLLQSA